jgi:hypothetical protein
MLLCAYMSLHLCFRCVWRAYGLWAICTDDVLFAGRPCRRLALNCIDFIAALLAAGVPLSCTLPPPDPSGDEYIYASLLGVRYAGRSGLEWLVESMCGLDALLVATHENGQVNPKASDATSHLTTKSDDLGLALLHMACACRIWSGAEPNEGLVGAQSPPVWSPCSLYSLPPYEGVVVAVALQRLILTMCLYAESNTTPFVDLMHGSPAAAQRCNHCQQSPSSMYICSHPMVICLFLIDALEDALLLPARNDDETYATLSPDLAVEALCGMLGLMIDWLHTAICAAMNAKSTSKKPNNAIAGLLMRIQQCLSDRDILTPHLKQFGWYATVEAFKCCEY